MPTSSKINSSDVLWIVGLGGAVAIGIAIAVTLRPPKEDPRARDYHKARLQMYGAARTR